MSAIEVKTVKIETTHRIELNKESFLQLLLSAGCKGIPKNVAIYVLVPGGGDWSNTTLTIDEAPVIITWSEVTTNDQI